MDQHEFERRVPHDKHHHHSGAMSIITNPLVLLGSAIVTLLQWN